MQYILTEEELDQLTSVEGVKNRDEALEVARLQLLKLADYTCIHDRKKQFDSYCDGCPCDPLDHVSGNYDVLALVCHHERSYGK